MHTLHLFKRKQIPLKASISSRYPLLSADRWLEDEHIALVHQNISLMHTEYQMLTRVPKQPHAHSTFSPLCHQQTRGFNHQFTLHPTCKNPIVRGLGTALH